MDVNNASAIQLSLIVGVLATLLAIVPATYLAWILARKEFKGKTLLSMFIFFPMVSPPLVTGFILLKLLGRNSVLGHLLQSIGITIPFTLLGAVIASAVVGFPLLVMFIRSTFAGLDSRLESYSLSAGRTPVETFFKVVLPLSYPGLIAGAIVCFARSLGEFGATVILAGNMEGETRTISMAIYSLLDSPFGEDQANTLLLCSLLISFISLLAYEYFTHRFWRKIEWK